jgi:hypothetical protein
MVRSLQTFGFGTLYFRYYQVRSIRKSPVYIFASKQSSPSTCVIFFNPNHTCVQYHRNVCKQRDGDDCAVDFQRINVAYQTLMSSMREAEERLEYWRLKYGLSDQDLDRYRYYVNDQGEDDEWFDA